MRQSDVWRLAVALACSTGMTASCVDDAGVVPDAATRPDASIEWLPDGGSSEGWDWDLPQGIPAPRVPGDNPMSEAKVELGRHLFYDERLSGNGSQSCASCHRQGYAFAEPKPVSEGSTGEIGARNAPSLINSAYSATLTWVHPDFGDYAQQIPVPMFGEDPVELGISGHEQEVLDRFRDDSMYQELFAEAYPDLDDPITFETIVKSIASFTRSIVSFDAPFDRYIYLGDKDALSDSARRGADLFYSERLECHHCHGGFHFSLSTKHEDSAFIERGFFNIGLYNVGGTGDYPPRSLGLYEFTGRDQDKGKFRAPSLRNVALTPPYMHDGSVATLEDVIRIYEAAGRDVTEGPYAGDGRENPNKSDLVIGFELTDQERADLLDFLESLSDESTLGDPAFADPFAEARAGR
jgi:cytochrome c peroxidase